MHTKVLHPTKIPIMMRILLTASFLILGSCLALAQKYGPPPADLTHFPAQWEGRWEGTLRIVFPAVQPREVPMALEILPIDSTHWHWRLIYNVRGEEDLRDYVLQPVKIKQGRWQIDERNGIVLGARLIDKSLFSLFEVDNQMLMARYSLEGDQIRFEITGSSLEPNLTGPPLPETPQIENIPQVNWFEVGVFQQALLRKKE